MAPGFILSRFLVFCVQYLFVSAALSRSTTAAFHRHMPLANVTHHSKAHRYHPTFFATVPAPPSPALPPALSSLSVVPFLVSFPWYLTGWAFSLPLLVGVSHVIPYLLIRDTSTLQGAANSRRPEPVEEGDDISQAAPTPTFGAPPSPPSLWSPTSSFFEGREGEGEREEEEGGGGGGGGGGVEGEKERLGAEEESS